MTNRAAVAESFASAPVVGVVRTTDRAEAGRIARAFIDGGLELIEITFTVPDAPALVRELQAERGASGPPWIGMGTVTTAARAQEALSAGTEFVVTPNASRPVAEVVREAGVFLVMGGLTPTEIAEAYAAGADLVKVFPVPYAGGPGYLATVRGPLGDVPMLVSGGFGPEEIPAYREAGASAYGIGGPLLGPNADETRRRIRLALDLARGARAARGVRGEEPA